MLRPNDARVRRRSVSENRPFGPSYNTPNQYPNQGNTNNQYYSRRMDQLKEKNKDIAIYDFFSNICMGFIATTLFIAGITKSLGKIDGTGFISIAITLSICLAAIYYNNYLVKSVLSKPNGTPEMMVISEAIKQGSEGYLSVQYTTIFIISGIVTVVLFAIYVWREFTLGHSKFFEAIGKATAVAVSFLSGAACSAAAGYAGVWASVRVNSRVAEAARNHNYEDSLLLSFRGGAISSILSSSLCIVGITFLYVIFTLVIVPKFTIGKDTKNDVDNIEYVVVLLGGYGFGASFVALFMQLGGGIYTKAADVGADMVGKIEQNIPEDDPRNPAVIADLVGDNVGDCAGSMADVFESIAGELIGTMILGASLAKKAQLEEYASKLIFFSLIIHALNLVVSIAGIMAVSPKSNEEPLATMKKGFFVSVGCALVGFILVCYLMLRFQGVSDAKSLQNADSAHWYFVGCGIVGLVVSWLLVQSTQYYTDYDYFPVKKIYEASETGHGTNVIAGFSVGMESTGFPALIISVGLYTSYTLGKHSGLHSKIQASDSEDAQHVAGLFGTAVATMGMLCLSTFILSMNNFGPIADNAGGIVEMSEQPQSVRDITDKLDAVGNVTKAATKGYAVGGSALACFLLFAAFMEEINQEIKDESQKVKTIDITKVEVMLAGLLGIAMIFLFVGFAVDAVGRTAAKVVLEVRRQFETYPGIMDRSQQPEYKHCVEIVTNNALHEMIKPALLALTTPIAIGCLGKFLSKMAGGGQLGIEMLASFLIFGTLTGLLMAVFLDNAGGAWDNAKKLCEAKNQKGTLRHHAAVTGDTVGDPFKDTAGPALHVIITTMSTTALVLGPLFINSVTNSQ